MYEVFRVGLWLGMFCNGSAFCLPHTDIRILILRKLFYLRVAVAVAAISKFPLWTRPFTWPTSFCLNHFITICATYIFVWRFCGNWGMPLGAWHIFASCSCLQNAYKCKKWPLCSYITIYKFTCVRCRLPFEFLLLLFKLLWLRPVDKKDIMSVVADGNSKKSSLNFDKVSWPFRMYYDVFFVLCDNLHRLKGSGCEISIFFISCYIFDCNFVFAVQKKVQNWAKIM